MTKRFIEETFPVRQISDESASEKNIRTGNISSLHIWWARKPLAPSRATTYAALIPAPSSEEELREKREFIVELSKREHSQNLNLIQQAQQDVLAAHNGAPPRVLDPFAGGGSIPLEAARMGCEVYASDLNPVAVLIEKATLEYPQQYGQTNPKSDGFLKADNVSPLFEDIRKWGSWVLNETKKEISRFYPEEDGARPVGYIWARTIPCQNPTCGAGIPLMRRFWLVKTSKKQLVLFPYADGDVKFKILGTGYDPIPENFDPDIGSVSKATAKCLVCGSMVDSKILKRLFLEEKAGQRLLAVVLYKPGARGKTYRTATQTDLEDFKKAEEYLREKREKLMDDLGFDPIPDEETPAGKGSGAERAFSVRTYALNTWGDLFNSRQKLALITFIEKVRYAHKLMLENGYGPGYARAVTCYLGFGISKIADRNNSCAAYEPSQEKFANTFGMGTLRMSWDYPEIAPIFDTFGYKTAIKSILNVIPKLTIDGNSWRSMHVSQSSATSLPYSNDYFDAVFTDPPYYDNVLYSYLSDFFYVILKRAVGDIYPDLFSTSLTPKKNEIVLYSNGPGGFEGGKQFFESMLKKSFQEIYRVLKPDGIAVIVYAHKSTQGWQTLINSLIDSNLVVSGAWPIRYRKKRKTAGTRICGFNLFYIYHRPQDGPPTHGLLQ